MQNFRPKILSSTGLLSIATLISMCPSQAQAACSEWVVPAKVSIQQSNETVVYTELTNGEGGFSGKATNSYYSERMDMTGKVYGAVEGSVHGSDVQFTIHWGSDTFRKVSTATGIYTGTVGPQGRATGTTYDEVNPESRANWYFNEVLQCRSSGTAAPPSSRPGVQLGRVKPIPGTDLGPIPTICQAARSARARGSPAAPGLERQCAAQMPSAGNDFAQINTQTPPPAVRLGRVQPAPVQLGRVHTDGTSDSRSICDAAADARARNSPAAPGLERQCRQTPGGADSVETAGRPGDIRLSRVYTAGGTVGALGDDFVELRNRGQTPLDLSGWSLQYASPQGATWQVFSLSGVILPDRIFLVAPGARQPDWAATMQFGMNAGKLALVRSVRALEGACPVDSAALVDFLGYGTANCSLENAVAAGAVDTAFVRSGDGCADTRDNGTDFTVGPATAIDRSREIETCPVN